MHAVEEMACVVCVLQRGHSGNGSDLASTLCNYDLFVLSWARVRQVKRGSISSELLMCGGGVRSILLLPLVARCLEITYCLYMAHICFYICCSDCVGVCGNVCAADMVEDSVFRLGVFKYVVCPV